jgi:hypothetical protein
VKILEANQTLPLPPTCRQRRFFYFILFIYLFFKLIKFLFYSFFLPSIILLAISLLIFFLP